MAKIFRKTHNPYALCAITHSLTLKGVHKYATLKKKVCFRWSDWPKLKTVRWAGFSFPLFFLVGVGGGDGEWEGR